LASTFFQIVVTAWLAVISPYSTKKIHPTRPVTFTFPQLYSYEECADKAEQFMSTYRPAGKAEVVCVPTDKREI